MHNSLESELQRGLQGVTAPPELWDRVHSPHIAPSNLGDRRMVWAMAGIVVLAAVTLSLVRSPDNPPALQTLAGNSQSVAFHCQNPAELRAWVKANAGVDVPIRLHPAASIQLIGVRAVRGRAEISYKAGNRDAVLTVSEVGPGIANVPHGGGSGKASSWVMSGERFTLACNDPAAFQLACKLCHLD